MLLLWGAVSLTETWPLDAPIAAEQLDGWQVTLAVAGIALFALAAAGYFRLYRRRRATFVFAVTFALALLAEAMVVIAWARNWHVSWWEWHVLMLLAFVAIALAARREWHEERYSALYLDETLAGARDVSILFADLAGFTPFAERHSPGGGDGHAQRVLRQDHPADGAVGRRGAPGHRRRGDGDLQQGRRPPRSRAGGGGCCARPSRRRPRRSRGIIPTGRASAPASTAARCWRASWEGRAGTESTASSGDTVNLASRLESEAPVGEVVLGAETVRRLPPGTLVERMPELRVKGKAEPIEAYVLRS